jgi:flagellar biosynthetic protein FliR
VTGLPFSSAEAMGAFLLVFFRITGAALSAPLLSNRGFPTQLRVWLVFLLALLMFPLEHARLAPGTIAHLLENEVAALLTVLSELAIGWSIGWLASVMVFAAQLAGHIIGQEIGFSIGEVFDPVSEGQGAITTQLFFTLALVGFVLLGGPELLVHTIHRSFAVLPPGGVVAAAGLIPAVGLFDPQLLVIDAGSGLWTAGVTLALPVMVGLMLATAAMAILARAVPEMNVFVLGFTIRIILGLFTTWLVLPFIGDAFAACLEVTREILEDLLRAWGG